ncbi:MAG: hypothetical protein ACHQ2F_12300 [Desulfobaccales bacterium]
MKKFFRPESVVFLAIWVLLILFGRVNLFRDPGTFWHTVVGRQILASHHFPTVDIYSFTFHGLPWTAHEWLPECLMGLVYGGFGFDGLLCLTAAALAGFYAWVFSRLWRSGLGLPLASLLLALVLAASAHHFHVRPHILSIIFLGLTFAWLGDFEAGRRSRRSLFWLWPLFLIWTNSHGGVLGGLGTLGLTVGGWTLWRLFRQDSPLQTSRDLVSLGLLLLGCLLTVFLTPYGAELPKTWLAILRSPVVPQVIQEHISLFKEPGQHWATLALGLCYLACLVTLPRRPRVTWLLPVVWLALACSRVRNTPLFAVTAALALAEFLPQVRWVRRLNARGSVIFRLQPAGQPRPPLEVQAWLVPGAAVLLTVMVSLASFNTTGQGLARLDPRHWPVELLPDLQRYEETQPRGTPIMNDMLFGGFLIFHTPGLQVFVDDRCEVYGDQFLLNYARNDRTFIANWIDRSGARVALTIPGSDLDKYFQGAAGWHPVKQTAAATLYRRNGA